MRRKFAVILVMLCSGCSAKHASSPSPVPADNSVSLITDGSITTVEDDSEDPTLNCSVLKGFAVHGDTPEAFNNLTNAGPSQTSAFMVGYGSPGELCTGRSSQCNSVATSMNLSDVDDWKDSAHLIRTKFSTLTLLGCNVGQYQDGADFISRFAEESKTTVRAPSGLVWCQNNSLTLEPQAQWVEAKPGQIAIPVSGPIHTVPLLTAYRLFIKGELRDVPVDATHITRFEYAGITPSGDGKMGQDAARSLAKLLDLGHPFTRTARPLARATARIEMSINLDGTVILKRFILYADAALRDLDAKDLFYPVDTRLHAELQLLRLR